VIGEDFDQDGFGGLPAVLGQELGLDFFEVVEHRPGEGAVLARVEPEPEVARRYDALYRQVYRKMYPRLSPLYRSIRQITGYPTR